MLRVGSALLLTVLPGGVLARRAGLSPGSRCLLAHGLRQVDQGQQSSLLHRLHAGSIFPPTIRRH